MNQRGPKSAVEQASNKACDACRLHKIRCLPVSIAGSKICQRCSKTNRECVWSTPQRRKQRKRTDTRVAELEREVSAMKALFDRKSDGDFKAGSSVPAAGTNAPTASVYATSNINSSASSNPVFASLSNSDEINFSTPSPNQWSPPPYSPDSDVVDRDILSMETAAQLFHSYNENLVQHYPAVIISTGTIAEEFRKTKPTLFLAIIAAAAGKSDPYLYSILNSEVLSAYAHRTLIRGEKSLELVQAMIITSIWYYPPGKYAQLKFYEYIHMAAVMALEIGLGTNPKPSRDRRRAVEDPAAGSDILDGDSLEKKRTFLACYMVTTGVAMSMRRPNMLRYNDWIDECLEVVANNPDITQYDKWIVAWVRLFRINEEFATSFSWDDSSNMANLSESRVQIILGGFEKRLETWRQNHEVNEALLLHYYHSQLYLHELALHDDHLVEDFRPPYNLEKVLSIHLDPKASSSHIDSVAISISSAHSLLDILFSMDVEMLRALPIFNFVRMAYSFITLIKLYISTKTPASHIGAALNTETLKLDFYLQAMIDKSMEAVRPKEFRAPFTFLGMLLRYQAWLKSQEGDEVFVAPSTPMFLDDCWLPPVPRSQLEKLSAGQMGVPSHQMSERSVENGAAPLQSQDNTPVQFDDMTEQLDNFGVELDLDQIMAFDGVDHFDSEYNWEQDMDFPYDQSQGASEWEIYNSTKPRT